METGGTGYELEGTSSLQIRDKIKPRHIVNSQTVTGFFFYPHFFFSIFCLQCWEGLREEALVNRRLPTELPLIVFLRKGIFFSWFSLVQYRAMKMHYFCLNLKCFVQLHNGQSKQQNQER